MEKKSKSLFWRTVHRLKRKNRNDKQALKEAKNKLDRLKKH